jgi:cobalt-zinc-cadmium efflux system protein
MAHHHHHHHHHHHEIRSEDLGKSLVFGIVLNLLFVAVELIAGLHYGSLALLSDAGHNFSDVIALLLALVALKLLSVAPNKQYTYGYRKTTIWAAFFNALILFFAVGMIGWESLSRWSNPLVIDGKVSAVVAALGVLINGFTAWLFVQGKDKDINIKGAYLHMLSDMMVSVGVVLSGLIILITGWYWVDTLMSWIIIILIVYPTWGLLKESARLALDGVPTGIDVSLIHSNIEKIDGVLSIHHVHLWALSTTENAFTAHLIIAKDATFEQAAHLKSQIKHMLEHENIQHVTLEIEKELEVCTAVDCTIVSDKESHHHQH